MSGDRIRATVLLRNGQNEDNYCINAVFGIGLIFPCNVAMNLGRPGVKSFTGHIPVLGRKLNMR